MFIINMIQHHWSGHLTQKIHDNAMTKFSWLLMFQCARLFVLFLHLFHCLQIQLGATRPRRVQLSLHLVDMTLSRGKPQQLNKMTLRGLPMDPKSKWFARYQWAVWTTVSHDFCDLEESYQSMAQTAKSESKLLLLQVPILLYTSALPSLDT